jgi:hypothetical protein
MEVLINGVVLYAPVWLFERPGRQVGFHVALESGMVYLVVLVNPPAELEQSIRAGKEVILSGYIHDEEVVVMADDIQVW